MQKKGTTGYSTLLLAAAAFAAAALWRAVLAVQHYRSSLAMTNDPSGRELEEVSAFLEAGLCLFLLAHAAMLLVCTRRGLNVHWPLLVVTGLICAAAVAGAFAGLPGLERPGLYAATLVPGVALVSLALRFNWVSLYTGALSGGMLGFLVTVPGMELPAGLFVIGPVLVYAMLGGGLAVILRRLADRRRSS